MTVVNFFWRTPKRMRSGNFLYLNRLTIKSHLAVGHDVKIWLAGNPPNSKYWINDLPVEIKDAHKIKNVVPFLESGGNVRTAATYWKWHFHYKRGGLTCDTSQVALKPFPKDRWILTCGNGAGRGLIGVGLIKSPKGHPVFLDAIKNVRKSWGNVHVFNRACRKHGLDFTHPVKDFFPFTSHRSGTILENKKIPKSYSLHLYHKRVSGKFTKKYIKENHPNSMLHRIVKRVEKH